MTNIGIFDSGLGGLSVLNEVMKNHKANYFYLGDNKRVPYGARSRDEIIAFSYEIVNFLEKFDIDFYIIACNTMAVNSSLHLANKFGKKFLSITDMGIKSSLENKGDVYLLATAATVNSHYYKNEIEKKSNKKVYEVMAPLWVDLIEKGQIDGKELDRAIDLYLHDANKNKVENILLGCTHYPIIKEKIEERLDYKAKIIDPAIYLSKNLSFKEDNSTSLKIFMTEPNPVTERMAKLILGKDIKIEKAIL